MSDGIKKFPQIQALQVEKGKHISGMHMYTICMIKIHEQKKEQRHNSFIRGIVCSKFGLGFNGIMIIILKYSSVGSDGKYVWVDVDYVQSK